MTCRVQNRVHFRRLELENLYNPGKSWLSRVSGIGWRTYTGFRFHREKNMIRISSIQLIHIIPKYQDNSECHAITITEKRLKMSKMKVLEIKIYQCRVFWHSNFKSNDHFRQTLPDIIDNSEKKGIFRIIESSRIKFKKKINFRGSITDRFQCISSSRKNSTDCKQRWTK